MQTAVVVMCLMATLLCCSVLLGCRRRNPATGRVPAWCKPLMYAAPATYLAAGIVLMVNLWDGS